VRNKQLSIRFGKAIRDLRIKKGYSQEKFADICGLHRTYIGSIERGEKNVTIDTAYKLAKAFGLPLHQLLRFIEKRKKQ